MGVRLGIMGVGGRVGSGSEVGMSVGLGSTGSIVGVFRAVIAVGVSLMPGSTVGSVVGSVVGLVVGSTTGSVVTVARPCAEGGSTGPGTGAGSVPEDVEIPDLLSVGVPVPSTSLTWLAVESIPDCGDASPVVMPRLKKRRSVRPPIPVVSSSDAMTANATTL